MVTRSGRPRSATRSPASPPWRARPPSCRRSRRRAPWRPSPCRICMPRGAMPPASRLMAVARVEAVGAYTLLALQRDGMDAGGPGQFFMLQAHPEPAGAYLPRALSAAWADERELAFLLD